MSGLFSYANASASFRLTLKSGTCGLIRTRSSRSSFNYANADTLYRYAQGRYNIGTITENEMLQLELNRLTEETNRMNARIEMDNCMQELRSYLGIQEDRELRVRISPQVPDFSVNLNEALA